MSLELKHVKGMYTDCLNNLALNMVTEKNHKKPTTNTIQAKPQKNKASPHTDSVQTMSSINFRLLHTSINEIIV